MARQYAVFVSSTYLDSQERREGVIGAIQRAGMRPVGMEWFTAATHPTKDECERKVRQCDVLVGILAHRYGWVPPGEGRSITEIEYDAANQRLMFLRRGDVDPERDFDDGDDRWDKQKKLDAFKKRVLAEPRQMAARFTDEELAVAVLQALQDWKKDFEKSGARARTPTRDRKTSKAAANQEVHDYVQGLARLNDSVRVVGFGERVRNKLKLDDLHVEMSAFADLRRGGDSEYSDAEDAVKQLGRGREPTDLMLKDAFRFAHERGGLRGLALLGDPGSGKTTNMRRLVLQLAQPGGAEVLGLPAGTVPVLVPLRDLTQPTAAGMKDLVARSIERVELGLEKGAAQRFLKRGRLLFLLDGLDEVKSGDARESVARWMERLLKKSDDVGVVVTCRYAGYKGRVQLDEHFLELHLRPLSPEQSESFVRQWFDTVERCETLDEALGARLAKQRSESLIMRMNEPEFRSARVAQLKRNPLLLSSICLIHRDKGELPKHRAQLYHECVHVLLERWRDGERGKVSIQVETALRLLEPIAYFLHKKEGRTRATGDELAPVLEGCLRPGDAKLPKPLEFLRAVRDESGLLTGWSGETYGFMHLGFQEYLAAHDINNRGYGDGRALRELAKHFGEAWWLEVTLLVLAIGKQATFERMMKEILARPNAEKHEAELKLCLSEASVRSAKPFLAVLRSKKKDAGAAALRELVVRLLGELDPNLAGRFRPVPPATMATPTRVRTPSTFAPRLIELSGAGPRLISIPAGKFLMGSPDDEEGRLESEGPQREVKVDAFELCVAPVTNAQYERFLKASSEANEPKYWGDRAYNQPNQPVVGISWEDAASYCAWAGLRLPSESEWEYACRAGTTTDYWSGGKEKDLGRVGWYHKNSGEKLHAVAEKSPNPFWLYDMHGNVWEWCADAWHGDYKGAPSDGSSWVDEASSLRVLRGGSFVDSAERARSAYRFWSLPLYRWRGVGFRPARSVTTR